MLELTRGRGVDVAIDYVSKTATLEAGAKALGRHGRLVTLGGAGQSFQASASAMLHKEQDLLGSRYVTRSEILETLDLVARGEVWPLVTDIRPLAEAEAVHERLERGEVTGRAALLIGWQFVEIRLVTLEKAGVQRTRINTFLLVAGFRRHDGIMTTERAVRRWQQPRR